MATQTITPVAATKATRNSSHPANELRWQQGQILSGKVMQETGAEKFLRIGRHDFATPGLTRLSTGQTLKLQVIEAGEVPVLRLLQQATASQTIQRQQLVDVPRQNSLIQLTNLLNSISFTSNQTGLAERLAEFTSKLPNIHQAFTAENLKQLFKQSGLFLEHHLAQAQQPSSTNADLKTTLHWLQNELRKLLANQPSKTVKYRPVDTPPPQRHATPLAPLMHNVPTAATIGTVDILDAVEAALSRQRLNQIESMPLKSEASRIWLLEIPVGNHDAYELLQLRIAQDESNQPAEQQTWTIQIAVSPPEIGPVHAKLTLKHHELAVTLWIEEETARLRFESRRDLLLSHLRQIGLGIKQIQIFQGRPPDNQTRDSNPILEQEA